MRHPDNFWIIYDCSRVPNVIRCEICGEELVVTTPARISTFIYMGKMFARGHQHEE